MKFKRLQSARRARTSLWLAVVALLALAAVLRPPAAHAANITVAAGEVAINANGQCSLREAIINANNDAATHADCAAGAAGVDTITLAVGTYTLTDSFASYSGATGLPQITSAITIDGNGATIDRSGGNVFRLFAVSNTGNLTLNDLALTDGAMNSDVGGGGIYNAGGTVTISDSQLSGHSGTNSQGGGAIRASGGTTTINSSILTGNQASNSNGGGGLYADNSATVTINDSTLSGNTASNTNGGAIKIGSGSNNVTLNRSTLGATNTANGGAALAIDAGSVTLNNVTVSGNTAQSAGGGGLYNNGGTLTLNNTTVTGNQTTNAGGGILSNSGTLNLNRSIVSGNTGNTGYDSGYEVVSYGTENANNYNVFGRDGISNPRAFAYSFTPGASDVNATDDGFNVPIANILNTTLANNGGPTSTHALVAVSPAIDLAPSAACTAAPISGVDQRGYPRNVDGNATASANECDAGAYEYLSSPPPTTGDIVIVKEATPADDTPFDFTENIPGANSGFTLTDPADNTETFDDIAPGTYTVTETGEVGWTLDDIICVDPDNGSSDAGATATIDLDAGETVTCTFSNSRDTGTIVINKAATPDDDTPFDFTEDIPGANSGFTLMDPSDDTETFNDVPTGSYTVTETGEVGWTLDDIICVDPDNGSSDAGATATIDLDDGETVTCTFSNSRDTGTIVIVKEATPADDTPFPFTEDIPGANSGFTLMDPSDDTETFNDVPTGGYTVTESAVAGWDVANLVCDDANSTGTINTATATINLEKDETVTCTFTNDKLAGTIVIIKEATPADDTVFTFTEDIPGAANGFTLSDPSDDTETFSEIPLGSYQVSEVVPAGWSLDDIDCIDPDGGTTTALPTATIDLDLNETVTCTFSNSQNAAPTPDVFVSAVSAGVTDDNLAFGPHDILEWDDGAWSKWFNGTANGLMPSGQNVHNIMAFWIPDPAQPDVAMTFAQNRRTVPGIPGYVDGMDIVWWNGSAFSLWFDGQDVGLQVLTEEKVDALHVLDGALAPAPLAAAAGGSCDAYLLISTQGAGKVPNYSGGTLKFSGEDVLGFCMTNSGTTTTGKWIMVLDGSNEGMPKHSLTGLSASADGQTLYLTTRSTFVVDSAVGGHSMVYTYEFGAGEFDGPIFSAPAEGLPPRVAGLEFVE